MKNFLKKYTKIAIASSALMIGLAACNKEFSDVDSSTPINNGPFDKVNSLDSIVRTNPNFTFLKRSIERLGLRGALADSSRQYTVFAPTDAAFATIGVTAISGVSTIVLNGQTIYRSIDSIPVQQLGGIIQYHVVAGIVKTASFPSTANPNLKLTSILNIAPLAPPASPIPVNMSLFLSRDAGNYYANAVPIVTPDLPSSNGIIHVLAGVIVPPRQTLKGYYNSQSDLTMLKAAIERADSGAVGTSRLDSLANLGISNLTLLAPTNTAFSNLLQPLLFQGLYAATYPVVKDSILAVVPAVTYNVDSAANEITTAKVTPTSFFLSTSPTVFSIPAFQGVLTATRVRGIVAYHILGGSQPINPVSGARYFSVNFNGLTGVQSIIPNPLSASQGVPVLVDASGATPKFNGLANGGAFANIVTGNINCVNGVIHKIDKVLRPQ